MNKRIERIEISESGISEYDRNRRIIFIHKKNIEKVSLEYGFSEERKLLSVFLGFVVLAIGYVLGLHQIIRYITRIISGEHFYTSTIVFFAIATPMIFIGVYYILRAFRYGYYLKITTKGKIRMLPFGRSVSKSEIYSFVKECNKIFGYKIALAEKVSLP